MKRKICLVIATLFICSSGIFAATTSQNIKVYPNQATIFVDGEFLEADNFNYNGSLYVPLRAVSENMSADVEWNNSTKIATITSQNEHEALMDEYQEYDALTDIEELSLLAYLYFLSQDQATHQVLLMHVEKAANGTTFRRIETLPTERQEKLTEWSYSTIDTLNKFADKQITAKRAAEIEAKTLNEISDRRTELGNLLVDKRLGN